MPKPVGLRELLINPNLHLLLQRFRQAISRSQPERELATLIHRLTKGYIEIKTSWGDVKASAGRPENEMQVIRLTHSGRNVGQITLALTEEWVGLIPLVVEYALLARLQSAAAGAARRRVGERTLEALLTETEGAIGPEAFAIAVAVFAHEPGTGASARAAHAHALDVLAGVGEGYLVERNLRGLCTVHHDRAVWLWPVQNLPLEAKGLFTALTSSMTPNLRLGISAEHRDSNISAAYDEARQALAAHREPSGYIIFQDMDPLYALLSNGSLEILKKQVLTRLATLDDAGKTEATLRAYLGHTGSLTELAEQHHVHVNTLRYRLRKAEEVLGRPLNDPALLAKLYLAFEA